MALIEVNWRPERQALRGFGWISLVAFAALGAWIYFRHTIFGFGLSESAANPRIYPAGEAFASRPRGRSPIMRGPDDADDPVDVLITRDRPCPR